MSGMYGNPVPSEALLVAAGVLVVLALMGGFIVGAITVHPRQDPRLTSFQGCARTASTVPEAKTCNRHLEREFQQ